jgi:uncharacterized protein (DUF1501 family)
MNKSRRDFLKTSLSASTLLAFSPALPCFLSRSALAASSRRSRRDSVLVVIQLSGGNDGLNTVVPYEDDAYHRNRPTLRIPASRVHKLDSRLGFHPDMAAFLRLYHEGYLSIVQGVGYPNSKRDHDGAKRDWHTACPVETIGQTGWVGRAIDQAYDSNDADLPGIFVGNIQPPFSLQSEKAIVPTMVPVGQSLVASGSDRVGGAGFREQLARTLPPDAARAGNSLPDFLRRTTVAAWSSVRQVETVARAGASAGAAAYPAFRLAQTLRTIAQLIRADVGVRIYFAELGGGGIGGFDTHAGQAYNHGALLRELSESVAAFVAELRREKLLERVLLLTFSEFGRTLAENGRRGTGHGAAAPMFLVGGSLKGGLVGAHPGLSDLAGDAPKFHTDFRRVYATALDGWLGFDSQAVLGAKFEPLDVLRS